MRKSPLFFLFFKCYKDGLYGERFMSILLDDEKLYYGFALDNCHEIEPLKTPKKTPKKTVKDFNKKLHSAKERQWQALKMHLSHEKKPLVFLVF
jgi:hypothetical protein